MSLARDIADHMIRLEDADRRQKALSGLQSIDAIEKDLARKAARDAVRAEERNHWVNVILPRLRAGSLPYDIRRGYY